MLRSLTLPVPLAVPYTHLQTAIEKIRVNPLYPCHPRSIDPYTDMKNDLGLRLRGHVFANCVQPRFPTFVAHRLTAIQAQPGVVQRLLDLEQKTFAISTDAAAPDRFHFRDRGRNHL